MGKESDGRRFAGTDPDALVSQLIWHVVGPNPAKSSWRAAAADWTGITGLHVSQADLAGRLGISNQAVSKRIAKLAAAGPHIPLTPVQRRALTAPASDPDPHRSRRQHAVPGYSAWTPNRGRGFRRTAKIIGRGGRSRPTPACLNRRSMARPTSTPGARTSCTRRPRNEGSRSLSAGDGPYEIIYPGIGTRE